jgi:endoglycosylceramidase
MCCSGAIRDSSGRHVIFHGFNVVYKSAPYLPSMEGFDPMLSYSETDASYLQKWGLNIVRLGVMWPGVEPNEGSYDSEYLDKVASIVEMNSKYGIFTILEAHQDSLAAAFCGEGIPNWAAQKVLSNSEWLKSFKGFPSPVGDAYDVNEEGLPSAADCKKKDWPCKFYIYCDELHL